MAEARLSSLGVPSNRPRPALTSVHLSLGVNTAHFTETKTEF